MADSAAPLIQLEEGGAAPILRYDIPEPTSYEGTNFIELDFDDDIFSAAALAMPSLETTSQLANQSPDVVKAEVQAFLQSGVSGRPELPNVLMSIPGGGRPGFGSLADNLVADPVTPPPNPVPPPRDDHVLDALVHHVMAGDHLVAGENLNGDPTLTPVPAPTEPDPHIYLVESIRLTSFLGDYGAGRIVKTFTLLPGEVTRISVKTFRQRESTRKAATSVLDSLTSESATDLEDSLQREQSDQKSFQKSSEYYVDAKASARWGWGKASVKAGLKGSTNATREEAVKNISNATKKHSSKASAKREVEINTSFEVSEKVGEERSVEREIENVNLSRTLNFVFRQMNQQFVSFLHLVDVRVGFFNGDGLARVEVPLSRLDSLLEQFVAEDHRESVADALMEQLSAIRDIDGLPVDVVRTISLGQDDNYRSFDRTLTSQFTDADGRDYELPGVLLAADIHVMRTEGVMVEALLGNGPALDSYAEELQQIEVASRRAAADNNSALAIQRSLVNQIIVDADEAKAAVAERLMARDCCNGSDVEDDSATSPSSSTPAQPPSP